MNITPEEFENFLSEINILVKLENFQEAESETINYFNLLREKFSIKEFENFVESINIKGEYKKVVHDIFLNGVNLKDNLNKQLEFLRDISLNEQVSQIEKLLLSEDFLTHMKSQNFDYKKNEKYLRLIQLQKAFLLQDENFIQDINDKKVYKKTIDKYQESVIDNIDKIMMNIKKDMNEKLSKNKRTRKPS